MNDHRDFSDQEPDPRPAPEGAGSRSSAGPDEDLPQALRDDLEGMFRLEGPASSPAEDKVREQLRDELAARKSSGLRHGWWNRGGLVAAALIAAVGVGLYLRSPDMEPTSTWSGAEKSAPLSTKAARRSELEEELTEGSSSSQIVESSRSRERLAADLDGNGKVDIRDAYALHRDLRKKGRGESAPLASNQASDLNRDGRIDRADVALIAKAAVLLGDKEEGK